MTISTHDPEPELDAALRQIARVEAPAGLRARVGTAIASPQHVAAGSARRIPAELAAAAALAVACVAGWWFLSGPTPLPGETVAGLNATIGPPLLRARAVQAHTPAPATETMPVGVQARSTPTLSSPPITPVVAMVTEDSHSLPPLPEPPEPVFENVGPAPLLLARLEEPAPIVIEPLTFPTAPPDQDGDTGDSPW